MEMVIALLMYLGDPPVLKEHLLMPNLSECLARKRVSLRSTNNAQFQCMKVNHFFLTHYFVMRLMQDRMLQKHQWQEPHAQLVF